MKEFDVRRDNLARWIKTDFGGRQVDFAARVSRSTSQVNQWLNGHRNIGERTARLIEEKLFRSRGSMDLERQPTPFEEGYETAVRAPPPPPPLTELEEAVLLAFRGLTQDQQREAIAVMERTRDANQRIVTELGGAQPRSGPAESQPAPPPRRERPPLKPYPEPFGSVQKEEPAKQGKRTG